jgi:hypothetical protein
MNDLKKIAPELSKIKKEIPFRAPENYFRDFPDRLQVIINSGNTDKAATEPGGKIARMIIPALKVAASIALVALLLYQPLRRVFPGYLAKGLSEMTDTAITEDERILLMIDKIDETSFLTLVDESDTKEALNSELIDEELLSYLCSDISDYDLLLQNTY